ncbi:hypothetical protein [Pseudomonas proteolytica]|uniref:hypothetical protein n=1 Tax=Pseudomonas proteolytica TaxID=219574 RepID=UPI001114F5E7|nr:hypothetical protein [Pseudomonas proteolytica]
MILIDAELKKKANKGTTLADSDLKAIPNVNPLPKAAWIFTAAPTGFLTALNETHLAQKLLLERQQLDAPTTNPDRRLS